MDISDQIEENSSENPAKTVILDEISKPRIFFVEKYYFEGSPRAVHVAKSHIMIKLNVPYHNLIQYCSVSRQTGSENGVVMDFPLAIATQ